MRTTSFPDAPVIQAVSRDKWQVVADHVNYWSDLRICAGFQTDGASIPRALWRVAGHPLQGDILPAAVEHDACYASHIVSRQEADRLFLCNLRALRIGWTRSHLLYWAVRLFGGAAYKSHNPHAGYMRSRYVFKVEVWQEIQERKELAMMENAENSGAKCTKKGGDSAKKRPRHRHHPPHHSRR